MFFVLLYRSFVKKATVFLSFLIFCGSFLNLSGLFLIMGTVERNLHPVMYREDVGNMISIIIPVYNGEPYLAECLDSVLAQTVPELEVLVIDDGSTDGTSAILEAYAAKSPCLRVIPQIHAGLSAGRNNGVRSARGEWICFVDADDRLEPDYAEYLYSLYEKTGCPMTACNHSIDSATRSFPAYPESEEVTLLSAKDAFGRVLYHDLVDVSAWGKLYRRTLFEGLSYPEGHNFEDTWLFGDLLNAAGGIAIGSRVKYHYRFTADSLSKKVNPEKAMEYPESVDRLIAAAKNADSRLEPGCIRRKVHAALSVRRRLIRSGDTDTRQKLNAVVRSQGPAVLKDPRAPLRDKLAIGALLMGDWIFDLAWLAYERRRYGNPCRPK